MTGLEPGGIVVIRFSRDGSERKMVADLAPITRALIAARRSIRVPPA